ncbi:MAG: 4-(cytidine 5'-diphospho)-2-C-methyl-D-erythritol kinase [Acidobacteria bacterium]|nr:4-(cytidine 5'-diphospho)-2-C-methyl-D-erythritol kinase [Acidobacteriota bacterium]
MPILQAFAKLNLGLKVLYKRPDNFHEIATLFQTISLADSIHIDAIPASKTIVETTSDVEISGTNLATQAALAWLTATGIEAHVRIHIEKRIPMGGGLGGGSTDAAAVLLALPALLNATTESHSIAARLGSDLPFFLHGGTAEASGRGEVLTPVGDLTSVHGVLVAPGLHISTPDAYRALNRPSVASLTEDAQVEIIKRFRSLVRSVREDQPLAAWAAVCENDFEPVAFKQHPQLLFLVKAIKDSGALLARMSGSGSTLFGLYESAEAAAAAETLLRAEISGHATAIRVEKFHSISRRRYERAWHTALSSFTDGASWPPRSRFV